MVKKVAIIGAGPAGLSAAEALSDFGLDISIYEAMPTAGRKLLMAGKSGLNITHSEDFDAFKARYNADGTYLSEALDAYSPTDIRLWADGLGANSFTGSSGRVFPKAMKAAPLLRAWLTRLGEKAVKIHTRHRWTGWNDAGLLTFETASGTIEVQADAVILALGGASWPRLGSNAAWVDILKNHGVNITPFEPANMGFNVNWSTIHRERFAGHPVKNCRLSLGDKSVQGDFVISDYGVEGSAIYTLSRQLRAMLKSSTPAELTIDMAPDVSQDALVQKLAQPRGKKSMSDHIRRTTGIKGVKMSLLRECLPKDAFALPVTVAMGIKALPIDIVSPRPVEEAISSAGGIASTAMDNNQMLTTLPGVFVAGEMLNWEAPTGGYLLTACFALGRQAGENAAKWLRV